VGNISFEWTQRISIYATYTPYTGETYYVRKTGNNSNNGKSAGQAWLTIAKAAQTMIAADKVYVGAGSYTGQIAPTTTGFSGSKIQYIADKTGAFTGDAGTVTITANNLDVLLLDARNYTEFIDFFITATGTSGRAARWQNSTNGLLQGCTLSSAANDAVSLSAGSLTITGCTLTNSASDGVDLDTNGLLTMSTSTISNNTVYGVNANATGCTIAMSRCIVQNNTSHGIYVDGGSGSVINCLVLENNNGLHTVTTGGSGVNIWNSTFVANDTDGIQTNGGTINVRNSIAANNLDEGFDSNSGTFTHSYNLSYGNGDNNYEGITKAANELEVSPQFAGTNDYRLVVGSPAINAGTNAAGTVDNDLNGNSRPVSSNWDLGCYEEPVAPPVYDDLVDGYSPMARLPGGA